MTKSFFTPNDEIRILRAKKLAHQRHSIIYGSYMKLNSCYLTGPHLWDALQICLGMEGGHPMGTTVIIHDRSSHPTLFSKFFLKDEKIELDLNGYTIECKKLYDDGQLGYNICVLCIGNPRLLLERWNVPFVEHQEDQPDDVLHISGEMLDRIKNKEKFEIGKNAARDN